MSQITSAGQDARKPSAQEEPASATPDTAPVRFGLISYGSGGVFAQAVAVADVNSDGKPDLLVANSDGEGTVGVLLNSGDDSFYPAISYDSGLGAADSIAVADLNGDGKPDLVVAGGSVAVLLGNGNGTFQPAVIYPAGSWANSVAIADVNGDGKLDLVVGDYFTCGDGSDNCDRGEVGAMLGNGDGTFQPLLANFSGGWRASSVAVADVNGDGKPDLVSTGCGSSACVDTAAGVDSVVGVLLGNGDGTFQPVVTYPAGYAVLSVAIGDLNDDGKPDVVVGELCFSITNCTSGTVGILLGNGDGTFQPEVAHSTGGFARGVAVGDVNGDGEADVVVAESCVTRACVPSIGLFLGNGDGTLQQLATYSFRAGVGSEAVTLADLNGDGRLDVAVSIPRQRTVIGGLVGIMINETTPQWTSAALNTSGSPSIVGQPVTFTATVSAKYGAIPDGDLVTFLDGKAVLGSVPLAGRTATFTTSSLSAKSHNIGASYAGNKNFRPSTGRVTQEVDKYTTTTALISNPNPSAYGQAVTFTATVASTGTSTPTGRVTFTDGTTAIGSAPVSGGVATLTKSKLAVGSHSITATYDGDAVSAKSTSSALIQVVN